MSLIEELSVQNRELRSAAKRQGRIWKALARLEADLDQQDAAYDVVLGGDDVLCIRIPIEGAVIAPRLLPAPMADIAPEFETPSEAAAGQVPEPEVKPVTYSLPDVVPGRSAAKTASAKTWKTGPYSAAEDETIRQNMAKGQTSSEIAKVLKRRATGVSARMRKLQKDAKGAVPTAKQGDGGAPARLKTPAQMKQTATKKARRQAQVAVSTPAPASVPPAPSGVGDRGYGDRVLIAHLDALGYAGGWTPQSDFVLVNGICGSGLGVAAASVECTPEEARARWTALNQNIGDLDHQQRLIRILREWAA
jgi:hypothetical protein